MHTKWLKWILKDFFFFFFFFKFSKILVCQPYNLRFSTAACHFLVSLLCTKRILVTIVSNKILFSQILFLKEHNQLPNSYFKWIQASFSKILWHSRSMLQSHQSAQYPVVGYFQAFESFDVIWGPQWNTQIYPFTEQKWDCHTMLLCS